MAPCPSFLLTGRSGLFGRLAKTAAWFIRQRGLSGCLVHPAASLTRCPGPSRCKVPPASGSFRFGVWPNFPRSTGCPEKPAAGPTRIAAPVGGLARPVAWSSLHPARRLAQRSCSSGRLVHSAKRLNRQRGLSGGLSHSGNVGHPASDPFRYGGPPSVLPRPTAWTIRLLAQSAS